MTAQENERMEEVTAKQFMDRLEETIGKSPITPPLPYLIQTAFPNGVKIKGDDNE